MGYSAFHIERLLYMQQAKSAENTKRVPLEAGILDTAAPFKARDKAGWVHRKSEDGRVCEPILKMIIT